MITEKQVLEKRHYCCSHNFHHHDEKGCKSPLCPCSIPYGGMVDNKEKVIRKKEVSQ